MLRSLGVGFSRFFVKSTHIVVPLAATIEGGATDLRQGLAEIIRRSRHEKCNVPRDPSRVLIIVPFCRRGRPFIVTKLFSTVPLREGGIWSPALELNYLTVIRPS